MRSSRYGIEAMYENERANADGMILLSRETMDYIRSNATYEESLLGGKMLGDLEVIIESEHYNFETEQEEYIINVYHNGQVVVENIIYFENNFYCTSIDRNVIIW